MSRLPYVPVSWHRVPVVVRDARGRLRATGELTDRWRAYPIGWLDHCVEPGLLWALDEDASAPVPVAVDHRPIGRSRT